MAQHAVKQPTRDSPAGPAGRSCFQTVVVHGSDISVDRIHSDLPQAEARNRFGGMDVAAIAGGALAGLGTAFLLAVMVPAIALAVGRGEDDTLALAGLGAGLLLWLVLGILGAAGAYSAVERGLPAWLDSDRLPAAAVIAAAIALLVSAVIGLLAGRSGSRWHRRVDDVIIGTRPGAVTTTGDQVVR